MKNWYWNTFFFFVLLWAVKPSDIWNVWWFVSHHMLIKVNPIKSIATEVSRFGLHHHLCWMCGKQFLTWEIRNTPNTAFWDLKDVGTFLLLSSLPLPDFGIAGHFVYRVVDVHCILNHCAVFKHLDLLGHASDGKVVTVTVKLNTKKQVKAWKA